jgi:hypothetical protein
VRQLSRSAKEKLCKGCPRHSSKGTINKSPALRAVVG